VYQLSRFRLFSVFTKFICDKFNRLVEMGFFLNLVHFSGLYSKFESVKVSEIQ